MSGLVVRGNAEHSVVYDLEMKCAKVFESGTIGGFALGEKYDEMMERPWLL